MKTKANDEPEVVYWAEYENGAIGAWTSFGWHWGGEGGANQIPTALYIPGYGWARRKVREEKFPGIQNVLGIHKDVEHALWLKGYGTDSVTLMDREAFDSYMQSLKDVPRTVEEVCV